MKDFLLMLVWAVMFAVAALGILAVAITVLVVFLNMLDRIN